MIDPGVVPGWLISETRIYELHRVALEKWGGRDGIVEPNGVQRVLGNALNAGFLLAAGEPDVLTIAAKLLYYFARSQVFADGNKRVAWMVMIDQLALDGLRIDVSDSEAEAFVLAVANDSIEEREVASWIAEQLVPVLPND